MFSDKIVLDFEIEKGDRIDRCYFSTRIKLTDKSKSFLCEKLGKLNNLDDYFDLNPENFYIYYNKYSGHYGINELYVRNDNGRYLATNLPLDHHGFSMKLSSDEVSIANYGFYPLYAIYNPNQYDKEQEKSFEDNGELRSLASSVLNHFLNGLTIQDMFLQIQNEFAEKEMKLAREKRQAEKELNQKNEKLRELIEKDEIKVFKVIKGHDIGNGRSAAILQLDSDEIVLDESKYYIAEYRKCEGDEYLHCMSHDYDILLDQSDLFFVLNRSSYLELESGFYSISAGSCAKHLDIKNRLFSDDQLSKQLCKNQVRAESTINTCFSRFIYSENF